MQISVKNVISDTNVNTVILQRNPTNSLDTQLMRCYKCTANITQVQGIVSAIMAGYLPSGEVPTITRCYKCGEQYTFQTNDGKKGKIKLTISAESIVTTFHCIFCRTQLVQYNIRGIVLLPTLLPLYLPTTFNCFTCQTPFLLEDIVEKVSVV